MKVGNIVSGLEVVDVKRVNKLNLIQFLKEVDNYLQQGYKLDVNSARQVGLVLQTDVFKTEEPYSQKTGSTSSVEPKEEVKVEEVEPKTVASPKVETVKPDEPKETETPVEDTAGETSTVDSTPEKPVKKPTTRSKKTAQ